MRCVTVQEKSNGGSSVLKGAVVALAFGVSGLMTSPAAAGSAPEPVTASASEASPFDADLQPGKFIWRPELAASGEVHAYVDLGRQLVHVYRGDQRIGVSTISSGKPGHETPTGRFEILQQRVEHYSNLYNNAPMPYMQRLTWDGIAFHAGNLPGKPASHGCIRLPDEFAAKFFGVMEMEGVVEIVGTPGIAEAQYAASDYREAPLTPRAETAELNRAAANGTLDFGSD